MLAVDKGDSADFTEDEILNMSDEDLCYYADLEAKRLLGNSLSYQDNPKKKVYEDIKNVIIKICLALGLKSNDFNKLLNSAGYSLSKSKFDLVISYCLENNIYDLNVVNDYLYTYSNAVL